MQHCAGTASAPRPAGFVTAAAVTKELGPGPVLADVNHGPRPYQGRALTGPGGPGRCSPTSSGPGTPGPAGVRPPGRTLSAGQAAGDGQAERLRLVVELCPGEPGLSTGIAGFTLGGGIGWLLREYGLTCDSLLSADVVTADGQLVTASEHEHPDLFWALRGGGGNFGVVTSMEFRLHPAGPLVFAGPVFYPGAAAAEVLRGWRDLTKTMPDQLTTLANILIAPPVPFLPEAVHGQLVVGILGVYAGNVEDGAKAAQPLRTLGEPLADLMGPMPYTAMQSLLDPLWTAGAQNYFTGALLSGLTDETIDTLLARHAAGRAPVRELHLHHCGGAMARVPAAATAFAHRNAAYVLNIIARSPDREGFPEHAGWARATHQAMDPWTTGGAYVNFTSESGADKVQASYPPDTYARLVTVKDRYDPANLFQLNQNIPPSGRS